MKAIFFSVYSAYSVVKNTISFRVSISLRRRDCDRSGLADTLQRRIDGCQSRQGVVRKVGVCHRVRSTGALKTRNLGPLTQSIVGHGHPFWEHLVASTIRAWHRIEPMAISISGRVVAGSCMIPLPLFLLNREVGPRSRTHGVASRIASGGDRYRHEDGSRMVSRTPEKRRILAQRQECRGRPIPVEPATNEFGC